MAQVWALNNRSILQMRFLSILRSLRFASVVAISLSACASGVQKDGAAADWDMAAAELSNDYPIIRVAVIKPPAFRAEEFQELWQNMMNTNIFDLKALVNAGGIIVHAEHASMRTLPSCRETMPPSRAPILCNSLTQPKHVLFTMQAPDTPDAYPGYPTLKKVILPHRSSSAVASCSSSSCVVGEVLGGL